MAQLREFSNHLTVNHVNNHRPSVADSEFDVKSEKDEEEEASDTKCCSSKSEKSRECYLIFSILILLTLVILLSAGFAINYTRAKNSDVLEGNISKKPIFCKPRANRGVCLTEGCVNAAYHILERANLSVDPCEDFYEFACGTFVHNTKIPDSKSGVTMFSQAMDSLKEKLRILIEDENTHYDSEATTKTKKLYASCMDLERIEKNSVNPLNDIMKEMGGWPVLEGDDWNSKKDFKWIDIILKRRKIGFSINTIFIFDVDVNVQNSSQWMIWLDQPILPVPHEYLLQGLNESDVQAFLQYAIELAVLLGANKTTAKNEMTEVVGFMTDMSKISMPREERRFVHHIHNVMNLTQLYELAPLCNWTDIINKILPDTIEVDDSELVNVGDVHYFGNLTNLLKKTPERVVANYLMLRGVIQAASFLSKDIRNLDLKFLRTLSGRVTHLPRWEQCIAMVSRSLSYAVSNLYVKHYLQNGSKEKVEVLVRYLRNSFDEMLKGLEWMDEETKKQALKKERAINSYIGYPEELLHDEYISEFYSNITIGKDLLENNLGIAVYNSDFYYSKLRKPIDKFDWRERGAVTLVNAFYNTAKNSIELPAGILQGAFYQADRPHYLNFGAIGFVIGHEITHGFDDQGRQYDMDGNLDDWWQADTEKRFLEKTNCIIEQYGNYTSETHDIKINGIYTQGENIADNGGIRVAYKAYMNWVEDSGKEAMLPGLVYTPNQLFWIASAQIWCSVYRPEFLRNKIISDNHSPEKFRVNGPLSNFDEFSEDWKCGANSKMNPEHKCIVW